MTNMNLAKERKGIGVGKISPPNNKNIFPLKFQNRPNKLDLQQGRNMFSYKKLLAYIQYYDQPSL